MKEIIEEVRLSFEQKVNPEIANKQAAYLKNKFIHFGLKTPARREITKPVAVELKKHSIDEILKLVKLCYNQPEREFHHLGIDIMGRYCKKLPKGSLTFIRKLIQTHSWWDTVDMLAAKVLGAYLMNFPEERIEMDNWIEDEDFWVRRSAILFQLKYKEHLDEERLFRYCKQTMHEKEFFIRKAIGWTLREYAKTHKAEVEQFVLENESELSGLSKREALR